MTVHKSSKTIQLFLFHLKQMSIKKGVFEVNLLNILVELEIYSEIIKYDRKKIETIYILLTLYTALSSVTTILLQKLISLFKNSNFLLSLSL